MNLFYYDNEQKRYLPVSMILVTLIGGAALVLTSIFSFAFISEDAPAKQIVSEPEVVLVEENPNEFSEDKLIEQLVKLNIKFPHIVLAQAKLETGNYTSSIFKNNNNLFGMKEATVRINTALGTEAGHAYYESWVASVYDYAFYQSRYLSKLKTEEQYFQYLSQNYAEHEKYVARLKNIIQRDNLKEIFS